MFCVGDKIVHPMHGAGVIESIVDEKIGRDLVRFYVFRMPVSGLTLKIPTANSEMIGVRAVSSAETIERVLAELPKLSVDMTTNWNHRYRENMERIKSGDLLEVAGVIKALMHRDGERGLSTGERKMLHNARQILLSEVVLAEDVEYADAEARVNAAMMAEESAGKSCLGGCWAKAFPPFVRPARRSLPRRAARSGWAAKISSCCRWTGCRCWRTRCARSTRRRAWTRS